MAGFGHSLSLSLVLYLFIVWAPDIVFGEGLGTVSRGLGVSFISEWVTYDSMTARYKTVLCSHPI